MMCSISIQGSQKCSQIEKHFSIKQQKQGNISNNKKKNEGKHSLYQNVM